MGRRGTLKAALTAAEKSAAKENKRLLSELPYYNCSNLEDAHPRFNSLIVASSRRSLENSTSLYDLNLFSLNPRNNVSQEDLYIHNLSKSSYFSPISFEKDFHYAKI